MLEKADDNQKVPPSNDPIINAFFDYFRFQLWHSHSLSSAFFLDKWLPLIYHIINLRVDNLSVDNGEEWIVCLSEE